MENIKAILQANLVGTLATLNEDGSPWATPVHVFADDEALYWFSQAGHQHSQNIERDGRVSLALWGRVDGTKGAYISGTAAKLNDEETAAAQEKLVGNSGGNPAVFENTSGYRLPVGQINSGKSSEKRWYFYS
jgi:nitroimidazol reductase NimA-like FMN-containing flavoprotein (pyridoxamine 5'-phosphate oxidase superfamily)